MTTGNMIIAGLNGGRGKRTLFVRNYFLRNAIQQIVGRERRERVSQLAWCGGGCFDSRRRVNSTVRCVNYGFSYPQNRNGGCCSRRHPSNITAYPGKASECLLSIRLQKRLPFENPRASPLGASLRSEACKPDLCGEARRSGEQFQLTVSLRLLA